MPPRTHRRTLAPLMLVAAIACGVSSAAPPLLAATGPLPAGAWRLAGLDAAPNPWPRVEVTLAVADDGRTVVGSTGCNVFTGEVAGTADDLDLGALVQTLRACEGDAGTAEAIVSRVLGAAERADVVAGRLLVRGAGRTLVFAPDAPAADAVVPGAPPVGTTDRLDASRFGAAVDASAANRAAWVRDPLQVALLFVDRPSTGATAVIRRDAPDGAATRIVVWLDGSLDDAVRALWFDVRLEVGADGAWRIVSAERARWCARGSVTDELVAGVCP